MEWTFLQPSVVGRDNQLDGTVTLTEFAFFGAQSGTAMSGFGPFCDMAREVDDGRFKPGSGHRRAGWAATVFAFTR